MELDVPPIQLLVWADHAPQHVIAILCFEAPLDNDRADFWVSLLRQLHVVVNYGGFCGASVRATASAMEPVQERRLGSNILQAEFTVADVDPGIWRVLLNMLVSAHVYNARLSSIDVRSTQALSGTVITAESALAMPYPQIPEPLPFSVEFAEWLKEGQERTVRIRFAARPAQKDEEQLISAILAWDELLLGGFPVPGEHPFSNACDATEAYFVDDLTLEHPMPNYLGAEEAFNVLVCMVHRFHLQGASVRSLTIE